MPPTEVPPEPLPELPSFRERLAYLASDPQREKLMIEALGRHAVTLKRYIRGETEPKVSEIVRILEATDLPADWLVLGYIPNKAVPAETAHADLGSNNVVAIPRLDVRASAGRGRAVVPGDLEESKFIAGGDWLRSLGVRPQDAEIIEADGDSMAPTILDRDLLLIDRGVRGFERQGAIYVLVVEGIVLLKRLEMLATGQLWVKSDNPDYQSQMIDRPQEADLRIEGRVKALMRRL